MLKFVFFEFVLILYYDNKGGWSLSSDCEGRTVTYPISSYPRLKADLSMDIRRRLRPNQRWCGAESCMVCPTYPRVLADFRVAVRPIHGWQSSVIGYKTTMARPQIVHETSIKLPFLCLYIYCSYSCSDTCIHRFIHVYVDKWLIIIILGSSPIYNQWTIQWFHLGIQYQNIWVNDSAE